jgi:catalase
MAKTSKTKDFEKLKDPEQYLVAGPGGATHQTANGDEGSLTTNLGVIVADNQNTLKSGGWGPSLLEDFAFREKITHSTTSEFQSASSTPADRAHMGFSR